jgi:hypothetical protein
MAEYQTSEAAMQAALGTSETYPLRDDVGKAQYEERVRRLLDAAGPVIWREAHEIDRSWSDAISEGIGLVGREMCAECDAFLGKEHRIGCSKSGQVSTTEAVEKFTTVAHANAEEPMLGLDAEAVALIIEALPDPDDPEVAEDWDPDQAPQQAEKLKALREGLGTFVAAAKEVEDQA